MIIQDKNGILYRVVTLDNGRTVYFKIPGQNR